jgi:hypothetical protein
MGDLIEMPRWFLALLVVAAGALGGGASLAIDHLVTRGRR